MLTFGFEKKLSKEYSASIDNFVDAINDMIDDSESRLFGMYLESFKKFIDFAVIPSYDDDSHACVESIKGDSGRIITKEKIIIDFYGKYINVCNKFCRIYFSDYNIKPFTHIYQAVAFRNIVCGKIAIKLDETLKNYIDKKYDSETYSKIGIKTVCIPMISVDYGNLKIPALKIYFSASNPYINNYNKVSAC